MGYNRHVLMRLTRLLVVVVAIVLPLQGMASVTAGQCMALGHHQDAGVTNAHDHAPGEADADHSHGAPEDTGNAHCGPCMSCCASASMAAAVGAALVSSRYDAEYLFSPLPPLGVEPDGVYRPPLSL